ncbi:MFS transporter [Arthrobacter sp. SDTb3-6]|uniref:MFS transporter n=1 Tax=Arthrobacter sp. SDTb3-6 TaxID=2713571 RepID=UPI0035257F83
MRNGVHETDAFLETKKTNQDAKVPVAAVLRGHWPAVLRVIGCSLLAVSGSTMGVFILGYATGTVKVPAIQMLVASVVSGVVGLVALPLWAVLSDRIGRRPVFAGSMVVTGLLWVPLFIIVGSGNFLLIVVASCVFGVVASAANGVGASMYTEMFPTNVRYTGVAIGTQLGFLIAGFAPAIERAIQGEGTTGWVPVAVFAAVCMFIAAASAWSSRETMGVELAVIDEGARA